MAMTPSKSALADTMNQSWARINDFISYHYVYALACTFAVVLLGSFVAWRKRPKIRAYDIDGVPIKELKIRNYSRSAIIFHSQSISKQGEQLAQDEPYVLNNGKHSEVVVHTPEHVREFLRQDLNDHWHPADLNFGDYFNRILGQCAGALYNQPWRTVRRYFDPAYTHGTSVTMIPVFETEVSAWLRDLKNDVLSSGVGRLILHAEQACKTIPLRAIPLSFYGDAYTEQRHKELVRLSNMQAQALAYTVMGKWQMSQWFNLLPTPSKRHLDNYLTDWKTFNLDILESARKKQLNIPAQHVFKGVDVEGGMTMDQYLQTIDEMIFTNIGITGTIIVFMFEQLAHHADFQQKLHEEIMAKKARADFKLDTYVSSSSTLLHYLCLEVVRLHPALGFSPPECISIPKVIGRYKLPSATPIVIDIRRLNTNPLTWGPDANQFRPERFASLSPSDYRYGYVRFRVMSVKPSECLGRHMVDVLMKLVVVKVVEKYRVEKVEKGFSVKEGLLAFVDRK
ncbi:cytochrome P450 [Amniculicola lignicola CBS 123094]|uniref:Cytochrome P450 n=1 Tax=Amniculicola lignicola CBS 123094 TaxID=1392246 RepID=A0A6A5W6U6_9PLEO|nr:cytochrome P450 [Amniculicola lignicola CBS 123094]